MRLLPRNLALLALVAALVVLELLLRPAPPEVLGEGPLFADLDTRRVFQIVVEPGPETPSEASGGPPLVLRREDDGWHVPSAFDHPALSFAVDSLLDGLAALRRDSRASNAAVSHARFGVAGTGPRIRLEDADGRELLACVQGVPPGELDGDGASGTFVGSYLRPAAGEAVYRAPHLALVSLDPVAWIDGRLLPFEEGELTAFSVELPDEELFVSLRRAEDGTWRAVQSGETLAPSALSRVAVGRLLDAAAALWAAEAVGPREGPEADALAQPFLRLALTTEAGQRALAVAGPWTTDHRRARAGLVDESGLPSSGKVASPTGWPVSLPEGSAQRLARAARELDAAVRAARGQ